MTIKDINPIEFAQFLHGRVTNLKSLHEQFGTEQFRAKYEHRLAELDVVAKWAARHIFEDDDDKQKTFLRAAGVEVKP